MFRWTLALALTLAMGCENEGENLTESSSGSSTGSSKSGFSADLAKEMGGGSGEKVAMADKKADEKKTDEAKKDETKKDDTSKKDEVKTDDAKKDETKKDDTSKKDEVKTDDAKKDETKKDDAKKDDAKKDDAKKDDAKKDDKKVDETKKDDTKKPDDTKKVDDTKKPDDTKKVDDTKKPDDKKLDPKSIPAQPDPTGPRVQLKPPAELAAIKLSLLPNWDRDVGEVGTISLDVKVPGKGDRKIFVFKYGYESAQAPLDRDAYKKWLEKEGIMKEAKDRQRGGAWLIEGLDASGAPAFRMVVNYSKRLLVCYGSMYRDAASNALTDIRDQTILQAKQICETITL